MTETSCIAVIGLQWGDEGKGKVVDWLATNAQHVARFQGGNNAGHTLVINGRKIVLHLVPAGIMQPETRCYIGPGVVLECKALHQEIRMLEDSDTKVAGRLAISPGCPLILRHHIELDRVREKNNQIGTTLRGIGPAHEDRIARRAVRLRNVLVGNHAPIVKASVEHANREIVALGAQPLDSEDVADEARQAVELIAEHAADVASPLIAARRRGDLILLEGAQGALLDVDQGTYPHVTSSNCIAATAASGLGVDLRPEPIGIAKVYATRVGNGVFPTELSGAQAKALQVAGNEIGATTGRKRRIGWLDIPALRHALAINGCQRMILTKIDVMACQKQVKICTAYRRDGQLHDFMIPDSDWLDGCKPVYEKMDGWEKPESPDEISAPIRSYIRFIEQQTEARIDVLSFGAERSANIVYRHPFDSGSQ